MTLTVRVDDTCYFGRAVDLRDHDLVADHVTRAIRGEEVAHLSVTWTGTPGPLFDHVGAIHSGMALPEGALLAAVARSFGRCAPQDPEREQVAATLASLSVPDIDFAAARERVAQAGRERDSLRERVATIRGRIQVLRDRGFDETDALATLRSAAGELAAAETERAAAMQALDHERERARERWDVRERRLTLQDQADNLDRAARAWLTDSVRASIDRAVDALPGTRATNLREAPADVVALAAVRVATVRAPVVLACDWFPSVDAAADWLDAPVVRVEV